jgi:hypothetical protein
MTPVELLEITEAEVQASAETPIWEAIPGLAIDDNTDFSNFLTDLSNLACDINKFLTFTDQADVTDSDDRETFRQMLWEVVSQVKNIAFCNTDVVDEFNRNYKEHLRKDGYKLTLTPIQ